MYFTNLVMKTVLEFIWPTGKLRRLQINNLTNSNHQVSHTFLVRGENQCIWGKTSGEE